MKGGKWSKTVLQWVFVALLLVFRPTVAVKHPPLKELHALTGLANSNIAKSQMVKGNWNLSWDAQGRWNGSNPCSGHWLGLVCWKKSGHLQKLLLSNFTLQGSISPALQNLSMINILNLAENELSGDIGPVLADLTSMQSLKLQGNNFRGSLDNWVQNMHELQQLILARNGFVGNVSTGIFTNLHNLTIVDISNNSLSGPIPDDLVKRPSLRKLSLSGNNFSGTLPDSLRNSQSLDTVDLSGNFLTGYLPPVWNTPNLTSLDLSGNNLSGPIPTDLLDLKTIGKLNLAQNNFVGNVSASHSSKFGCNAFAGNPGLVMQDPTCTGRLNVQPAGSPSSQPAGSPPSGPPSQQPTPSPKKSLRLSTITIVALTVGNVVLILMSLIGFVLLFMWWKRSKVSVKSELGDNTQKWTSSPIASKGDHSSKDIMSTNSVAPVDEGPGPTSVEPKSTFSSNAIIQPQLKSVTGTVPDPVNDSVTTDISLCQSFSHDFGASVVILDTTLALDFEDLLGAKGSVLGAGGFGVMYMASQEDGHVLAIKRIEDVALADQRAFGKQCAQLAEALHPNLLQLRGWSLQEKLLIYDYLKNGSVHSLLHAEGKGISNSNPGKAVDWATRLKIAVGTARALAHLHDSDMVHGNIKASNVLLDEQFEPRVSDFGMETLLQRPLQQHSRANAGYRDPELVTSATRRRTQDGHVYSLGVLLLELLTGKEPKGNDDGGLPAWVQEMTSANRTVELFDPALVSMHVLPAQDVLEFLELAQACVSSDAAARPSITIVLRSLESIVPGSTAPRSCDVESTFSPELNTFFIPVTEYDDDDIGSFFETTESPFSPGVKTTSHQKLRDEHSRMVGSPDSSASFYSNVSSSCISPSRDASIEAFSFRLSPFRQPADD